MTKSNALPDGTRFGKLTITGPAPRDCGGNRRYSTVCDCGTERVTYHQDLTNGDSRSCGCSREGKKLTIDPANKGQSGTALYKAWANMHRRCRRPSYAEKGITVFPAWESFTTFAEWARRFGFEEGLELDRRNNAGGYTPLNCRWVTKTENLRNKEGCLPESAVERIRIISFFSNLPVTEIAAMVDGRLSTVSKVVRGETWKGVGLDVRRPSLTGINRREAAKASAEAKAMVLELGYCQ